MVEVGFLPVGHIHEDIDGTYGRLSRKLMWKDIFSLSDIMDTYRTCEDQNLYVPYLIDVFYDFKSFVNPQLLDMNANIIGIRKCQFFRFVLRDHIYVMQWRESLQDEHWSSPIHLWCSLSDGNADLIVGQPRLWNLQ